MLSSRLPIILLSTIILAGAGVLTYQFRSAPLPQAPASSPNPNASPPPERARVESVIDGLTIKLDTGHIIRYLGVRVPDVRTNVECFSREVIQANEAIIGEEVRLEEDPVLTRAKDGAWVRYVYLQQVDEEQESEESPSPIPSSVIAPASHSLGDGSSPAATPQDAAIPSSPSPSSLRGAEGAAAIPSSPSPSPSSLRGAEGAAAILSSPSPSEPEIATPRPEGETRNDDAPSPSQPFDSDKEIFINERMLEGGFGFPLLSEEVRYKDRMLAAARYAKATQKGLWGQCEVEQPQEGFFITKPLEEKDCIIKGKASSPSASSLRGQEAEAISSPNNVAMEQSNNSESENASNSDIEKKYYYLVSCSLYSKIIPLESEGGQWLCSEEEAKEQGFELAPGCQ